MRRRLAQQLKSHGIDFLLTREPGGSAGAEIIRHIILSGIAKPLGSETETILFAAARDDHVRATIEPALAAGKWVVCDRFVNSTRVYQGALGKVDMKLIYGLERVTVGDVMPDLTFLLDVPANIGLARAKARRGNDSADRFEAESVEYHEELRQAFLRLAEREPKRIVVIDGRAPRDVVAERVWAAVEQRLLHGDTHVTEVAAP